MSDSKKVKLRGSNKRNIKFSYKQGDQNWHKFDAQGFRIFVSNIGNFTRNYKSTRRILITRRVAYFIAVIFIIILSLATELIKKYTNGTISEEKIVMILFGSSIILAITIFNFIILFKDREQYGELERIRKYKPNKELSEKKQRKSKKQIKEETPWEL